jgi:hypothetical protein
MFWRLMSLLFMSEVSYDEKLLLLMNGVMVWEKVQLNYYKQHLT